MRDVCSFLTLLLFTAFIFVPYARNPTGNTAVDATAVQTSADDGDTLLIQKEAEASEAQMTKAMRRQIGGAGTGDADADSLSSTNIAQQDETPPPPDTNNADIEPPRPSPAVVDTPESEIAKELDQELIVDEETDILIADDEEESLLDGVVVEPSAEEPADSPAAVSGEVVSDSAEDTVIGGTEDAVEQRPREVEIAEPVTDEAPSLGEVQVEVEPEKPAVIEDARSIDFAKGLREYRSPRLAMLLSLAVPGLGQAYAKRYWKTAVFGVAELAVVGVSINYALKGKRKQDEAMDFADKHYRERGSDGKTGVERFYDYYQALKEHIEQLDPKQYPRNEIETEHDGDVGEWLKMNLFYEGVNDLRNLAATGDSRFYDYIGERKYVHGWDDAEPATGTDRLFPTDGEMIEGEVYNYKYSTDSTKWLLDAYDKNTGNRIGGDLVRLFGYSSHQLQYNGIVHESNDLYKTSTKVLMLLLANHLVSAVDAFITARAHNERLLGRETLWERIHLDQRVAFDSGGLNTALGVRLSF
ncbi:MAG: hypothetical protein GF344_19445 [Chitinivibrionales bacterium]|nr:hypothetical protein [Chitinivibrionales bacterium]MBD3358801.1 hypothetical protein [Chitinivibrionales bacterium]